MPKSEPLIDLTTRDALYKILGMKRATDDDDGKPLYTDFASYQTLLKKKYRRAALKHHPDSGGLEENFRAVSLAFEILNDEKKKDWYDETLKGVFSHSDYEEYMEMEKFSSHFSEQAFQSLILERTFVQNPLLNKIINVGWKLVQIGAFAGLMFGVLLLDVFWQSPNRKMHWGISALSAVFAYFWWGRILSCWCIFCWCFAPWTMALVAPIVYSIRWPLWIGIRTFLVTEMIKNWKIGVVSVGILELVLHFFYGVSWTRALYYSTLIYIFRPLLIVLILSGTLVAQIVRLRALYVTVAWVVYFLLDVFWLHWLPVGYTKKFIILIWMTIFILSSPGKDDQMTEEAMQGEEDEVGIATESVTPAYAPPPPSEFDDSRKASSASMYTASSGSSDNIYQGEFRSQRDSFSDEHEFNQ